MQEYLTSRTDSESALFISMRDYKKNEGPKRMPISSVETSLRKIGEIADVKKVMESYRKIMC